MRSIALTREKIALVSNCDYEYLKHWKWYAHHGHASDLWYARNDWFEEERRRVFMHAIIAERMGLKGGVDHIDGNGLNNQRSNLRLANGNNAKNRKIGTNNKSGYKGVYWRKDRKIWVAAISINGKQIYLVSSPDKKKAALMYNAAALKYHGEFASLNEVKECI